ncbi:glycosyltransferase [Cellulomonas composti]|uniref:Glycosyl transferase n=1 Tax=Cellulomonas composti TaxID=266130 RepID=A0A511JAF3_9CELL|nr:glycosyltransferase [Cellulomonas composti]GEL94972.1 glycosyl transferase [Cellulomonas composti]
MTPARHLVVAHPSTELYGADQQMLESLTAAVDGGWRVTLVLPGPGPLAERGAARGARVVVASFPVLRKSLLSPRGLVGLAAASARAMWRAARWLRREGADALYVSTVTIPSWLFAARLARVPVLCHVHEAESDQSRFVTAGLTAPLLVANRIMSNSAAARDALARVFGRLGERTRVVPNGVPGPPAGPVPARVAADDDLRLVLVGRLSPRKGTDVAVEAVGLLVREGLDVRLRLAGSTFDGYEWFEDELRTRIDALGLADRVTLLGFVHPPWAELAGADVALVPSRVEPFGNTAVEAMLAGRAVVASAAQGLLEVVHDERTGLLVAPGDAAALADALRRLHEDRALRARLAAAGRADALDRFSTARYASVVRDELDALVAGRPVRSAA